MKLTPPTKIVFWISVVLVVLGLLGQFGVVAALGAYVAWLYLIGYVVLLLGLLVKGM